MTDSDKEITSIGQIAAIMEELGEDQRGRVIRYILERFGLGITLSPGGKAAPGGMRLDSQAAPTEFADFASLVDASHPETESMRALVAGYWQQVCHNAQSFDAQS